MNEQGQSVIALLGQPNSGKSTLFNALTGSRQHVGNWPGKTVEKKEGYFSENGITYMVTDLPGTYSLSANSDEEVITRDYIAGKKADMVCILADASQLERSLYMLADYAGIHTPCMLLLNMMDVAKGQGKEIRAEALEKILGIPVLPFVAADKKSYPAFFSRLRTALNEKRTLNTELLEQEYQGIRDGEYQNMLSLMPPGGIDQYTPMWLAVKCLEGDRLVAQSVLAAAGSQGQDKIEQINAPTKRGSLLTGNCKFAWIHQLLQAAVEKKPATVNNLSRFDKAATSRIWGKPIAIGVILLAICASMIVAAPIMLGSSLIPALLTEPLRGLLLGIGVPPVLISFLCDLGLNIVYFALSMSGFVLGITFVFSFIEEVGYMARISFVFDSLMSRLGLQGKSIMAFLMGFGCTIGGAAGTRVIDNWGQRVLAMALVWAVPCGATWAIMPTLASIFFGSGAVLVMIVLISFMFVFMAITAKVFGDKLSPKEERTGMIMEMPPYHKPRWGHLVRYTLNHAKDIFIRAMKAITLVALVFWVLSYSKDGDPSASIIYRVGIFIEPLTRIFGLSWQTFMAFVASAISKEAVLGVLSSLYANSGSIYDSTMGSAAASSNLGELLAVNISKAEALAFIFATTYNVPCVLALASTYHETHSARWTARIALYYTVMALILCGIVYRIGLVIF
ncbi:MAG: ferrous iron transport protein B [Lachnospiraceae bacterium]